MSCSFSVFVKQSQSNKLDCTLTFTPKSQTAFRQAFSHQLLFWTGKNPRYVWAFLRC